MEWRDRLVLSGALFGLVMGRLTARRNRQLLNGVHAPLQSIRTALRDAAALPATRNCGLRR